MRCQRPHTLIDASCPWTHMDLLIEHGNEKTLVLHNLGATVESYTQFGGAMVRLQCLEVD